MEDAGDQGALGVLADLLFDEGGEDDCCGSAKLAIDAGAEAELGGDLAEALDHGGEDLGRRDVAGEAVGVGEEIAFERGGVGREVGDQRGLAAFGGEEGIAGAKAGGLDRLGDVEDVVALGDGEGDGVDVAAG